MRTLLTMAAALVAGSTSGLAQPVNPSVGDLALLLDRHGYGDVRSLEAEDGALTVSVRLADGRPARAVVDERQGTVSEVPANMLFVSYPRAEAPQMTFRELASLLDATIPGSRLTELKRNQGAFEVHLRVPNGKAVGMLVNLNSRKIMPYHSQD